MKPNPREEKKAGSALLVVLGFLSFMVVSAVAFAIYMRAERVPSSALRRNVATRHLVKAAMAQAMSRVDDAIRNDPFPGLVNTNNLSSCYRDVDDNVMDMWYGRVFMPPNPAGLTDDRGNRVRAANDPSAAGEGLFAWRFAPVTETVSVLNLEALGYIPPPLVNDVRFLSRSTWTAKWQNFAYDAGRFAFCAVNVSDYFDINRMKVGTRSSPLKAGVSLRGVLSRRSDPRQEENVSESDIASISQLIGPDAVRPTGSSTKSTTEYVSLLDYNLAFGASHGGGLGPLYPFFYNWLENPGRYFYGALEGTRIEQAMRQTFVTDSFSATSNRQYTVDFAKLSGQPYQSSMNKTRMSMTDVVGISGTTCLKEMVAKGIIGSSPADLCTIYDYLDHDDVPVSLSFPGVECVPMVTAVEPIGKTLGALKVNPPPQPNVVTPNTPGPGVQTTTREYTLDPSSFLSDMAAVRVLVAYPFRHFSGRNDDYKLQVVMKVFVASGSVSVRPADGLADLRPKDKTEWNRPSKAFTTDGNDPGDALAWTLYSNKVNIPIPRECKEQNDALIPIDVTRWNGTANIPASQKFFTQITEQPGTVGDDGVFRPSGQKTEYYQFDLRPYKDGALVPAGRIPIAAGAQPPYATDEFRTYAMLWVRVTDSSGDETYDLAPAVVDDDRVLNGTENRTVYGDFFGVTDSSACLLFSKDPTKFYTYANLIANNMTGLDGAASDWAPKSVATVDPRYNYAPEDWFAWNKSGITGDSWLNEVHQAGFFNVADGRDPDIFMFTSNQGYLQSLGEFAFLPRLSEWQDGQGNIPCLLKRTPGKSADATYAAEPKVVLNNICAWRTYPVDRYFYSKCEAAGIGKNTDRVQTINPYSDNTTILSAAFAYTPCDYWTTGRIVAGEKKGKTGNKDDDFEAIVSQLGDKSEVSGDAIKEAKILEYSFCEKNQDSMSKMKPEDVYNIAYAFSSFMRRGTSWEAAYDEIFDEQLEILNGNNYKATDDNAEDFMGVDLNSCPLYSIDRKFLYSYWRDCFANNQQLFLIFVRAEATALGGPGEGTPSQQGGRAVALVWREPQAYNDGNNPDNTKPDNNPGLGYTYNSIRYRRPHRMRVLFYHQFD